MRFFLVLTLISLAAAQQAPEPPKKARIEGSVVSLTGEAIPRAQVRLAGQVAIVSGQLAPAAAFTATAGDDGKFAIENIDPGSNYQLTAQRPGFVNARYGARSANAQGAPLSLEAGQSLKGLTITMTPQGIISGRITDQAGDPVQGSLVAVMRRGYQRGVRSLALASTSQTNDQGEYRVPSLAPGRYYVVVTARSLIASLTGGDTSSAKIGNVTTYYPNGPDVQSAAPIDITPGTELRGIDVRLRQERVFSIRGKVVDANGAPALGGILGTAIPREEQNSTNILNTLNRGRFQPRAPDGSFEIGNLAAGSYVLEVLSNVAINGVATTRMSGRLDVTITDADVTGVTFALAPATPLKGTLRLEDGDITKLLPPPSTATQATDVATALSAAASLAGIQGAGMAVALINTGSASAAQGRVGSDGTFTVDVPNPSKYQLNVGGLPKGHYVKSVHFGGTDVTKTELDLTSGAGGSLDIVLSDKAADITGVVRPQKEESTVGVTVTLWPRDPEPGAFNNGIKSAVADQNGGFQFTGLRPGVYYAAAWEDIDSGLAQARDFLTLFTSDAVKLELAEGAHSATEVKLIPTAKIKTAEEKLP